MEAEKEIKSKTLKISSLEEKLRENAEIISNLKNEQLQLNEKNEELHESSKQQNARVLELMRENSELSGKVSEISNKISTLEEISSKYEELQSAVAEREEVGLPLFFFHPLRKTYRHLG